MLDDVRHQLIDDQCQRNGHVSRHIHALDIGRDPIGTTIGSADLATQIAAEGVETHDAYIFARVETFMHSRNREDPGSRAAQGVGGLCALRVDIAALLPLQSLRE
jgi:hypothetical protein